MGVDRREFIKLCMAAGAAAAAGISLTTPVASAATEAAAEKWVKGVCRFCGTGCGVYVGVAKGKVVAVRGNPEAKTNFGFLCVKGFLSYKAMSHPDRLTHPLIRQADGKFKKVTWNQALDHVAARFKHYHRKFGKDAVAYYGSGQCTTEESYTFNKLWKGGFGSNMVEGNPRLCMASAVGGYITSLGDDEPAGSYADIEHAKCFFIVGSNMSECHPIIFRRVMRHKLNNPEVKVIVCEPRRTSTSKIADLWLPVDPGTDLAIFHALAREIIKNNLHDASFIEKNTTVTDGKEAYPLDEYIKLLDQFDSDSVAKTTRCPAENIRQAARLFATSGATMSMWCMGLNQRTRGVWANNLIHNLHLITGNYGKPGADAFSLTGQPNACGGVRETGTLSHLLPGTKPVANDQWRAHVEKYWGLKPGTIDPKPGFHTIKMFESLGGENEPDKPLKAMLVSTTNPAQSLPNLNKYIPGMKKSFLVVLDIFPTRTTQLADVVLPAAFLYEKGGVFGCSERRSQLTEKAVEPPGEARSDLWIAAQLAKRMGHEKLLPWNMDDSSKAGEMAWNDYTGILKDTGHSLTGATYQRLKNEKAGLQWPVPTTDHPGTYKRYVRGMDPYFDQLAGAGKIPANRSIYFYGKPEGKAAIWLRPYKAAAENPDQEYPFFLTTGRVIEQWHTGTMTMRIPEIARSHANGYVELHPDDARKLKVATGDMLKLTSRRGDCLFPARITDSTLPGVLFVPMHDQAVARMVNFICNDEVDPGSFEPEYKVAAVKIERAGGPRDVAEKYIISDVNQPFG